MPKDISQDKLRDLIPVLEAEKARREAEKRARNKIASMFPSDGPYRRDLYKKHLEFFRAGSIYKQRLFLAGNRVGKSEAGSFEAACHLTGLYPDWWEGKRFAKPIEAWASGTTSQTTRDIVQDKFLGPVGSHGTGMIPADCIDDITAKRGGLADSVESVRIKHVSGGFSNLGFKSYEQGRKSYEGTSKHLIFCDEEPPEDCYVEMLYRTMTTRGIVMVTFTPLEGRSKVVNGFLEPENEESAKSKWFIQAGWRDVPHIPPEEQKFLIDTTPPYQIEARMNGEPVLGSGAIYPIPVSEITADIYEIPDNWPRVFGLDVGHNVTAALWAARNPATGVIYFYDEYYGRSGDMATHVYAIKSRGEWINGVVDPAANGRSQIDGRQLLVEYRKMGLHLQPADNTVETGIQTVWQLLTSGMIKFLPICTQFFSEFRQYHRKETESGGMKIVKRMDHLVDVCRYVCMSGRTRMTLKPKPAPVVYSGSYGTGSSDGGWMV